MRKLIFFIVLLISQSAYSQYIIKGKVLSAKTNQPIPGANLIVKEGSMTMQSGSSGEFALNLPIGKYTLTVKHIGYTEKVISFSAPYNGELVILLPEGINELNEVNIRTGYQEIPKDRATGAFTVVDNKTLNEQSGTNILARLDGVTSGLAFDTKAGTAQRKLNFNVRVLSSINGPMDPLIVLDNFPYDGNIENINPNDVESVTILKDAAAASIWGARAGNGVVVITTKKGRLNQKMSIEGGSTLIISDKPDYFKLPEISSQDYIDVEQLLFSKGLYNSTITNQPYAALTPAVEVFLARRNRTITPSDSARRIDALKRIDTRQDYADYFLKRPIVQQYFLNIAGGTEKTAYTFSGAYDKSQNETGDPQNKLNLRVGNTYKLSNNLTLDFGLYYTYRKSSLGATPLNSIKVNSRKVPYLDLVDENGKGLPVAIAYNQRYTATAGSGKLMNWDYIPFEDNQYINYNATTNDLISNFAALYRVTDWLSINATYQYEKQELSTENLRGVDSYSARNMINSFTQINPSTGLVTYIVPKGGILNGSSDDLVSNKIRGQLNINKRWRKGQLSGIIGAEINAADINTSQETKYGYQENPISFSVVDLVNSYPSFITGGNQKIEGGLPIGHRANRYVSTYTNFAYTYDGKYTLSASARRDASNVFGLKTNDKWNPLWSAGASWKVSEEKFYQQGWLPSLTFRVSYGYQGNVDLSKTGLTILQYGTNRESGFQSASVGQLGNPELRWEKTGQLNFGLDFSSAGNRLSGSIDYYRKHGTDLYGPVAYDYTAWGLNNTITRNVADMIGDGIDVNLQTRNFTGVLAWTSRLLFNYNSSKVSKYFQPVEYNGALVSDGKSLTPAVGYPLYAIASYRWAGLDNAGNPQGFLNGVKSINYAAIMQDGATKGLNSESIIYHGRSLPNITGSLINDFEAFGFRLSFNIAYKFGYYFRRPSLSYNQLFSVGVGHSEFAERWQSPGDELHTDVPSLVYPANVNRDTFYARSEATIEKGDHIRLKYINLSHNFSNKVLKVIGFKDVKLFGNVNNLGILWRANKKGLDPDYAGILSPLKTYTAGLSARL
ncbi:SusC/RagA family TonB-linked outer membrane protein [Pedobacter duraquae]|uniref:TonB-linked SusC/RagA family outer membrane protein n=1 Tax=Pedobacter duraquae TaxID=425511 RepID=A0A4R6INP7_9SPHI|nr:SusC/RagA family TonB-linked outer membrane protein [Pedobacter duraquae]TDO23741.1 TonB-linked SusC/RagA family outer membrane protein [Pedobacter duraquae]